jgi:hypothetical protein
MEGKLIGHEELDHLGLQPDRLARLAWLLQDLGLAISIAPADEDDIFGAYWHAPGRRGPGSRGPFAFLSSRLADDGVVECRLQGGSGRPSLLRVRFETGSDGHVQTRSLSREIPAGVTIRRAGPGDFVAITALERDCPVDLGDGRSFSTYRADLGALLKLQGDGPLWVAELDGEIISVRSWAIRELATVNGPIRIGLSQLANVHPKARGLNLFQCFARQDAEEVLPTLDHFMALMDPGNTALWKTFGGPSPNDWPVRVLSLTMPCDGGCEFGRTAEPRDAARLAEMMNAAHAGASLYAVQNAETIRDRLERAPGAYAWGDVLVSEHAAVGVWMRGDHTCDRSPLGVIERTEGTVMDFGYVGEAGLEEFELLLRAQCERAAARGITHLTLFSWTGSPIAKRLVKLFEGADEVVLRCSLPQPTDLASKGVYTDPVYFA